ncbi:MAG TPA: TolC family protein, partial [Gemmatimonadaceae bacterium]|nr:TolC family protein [Gemmatimonadaceae bacterium]
MTSRRTLLLLFALAAPAGAQQVVSAAARPLSLEDAVRLAQERSEDVTVARAGLTRARGQLLQARSRFLPQLDGSLAYTKTLKSQFEAFGAGGGTDSGGPPQPQSLCAPRIPANATPEQRAAALAQATTCESTGGFGGIDFSKVGFGAKNQWALGLQFAQPLFTGGRVTAGFRAAQAGQRAAELTLTQRRAQIALETTQAYYDAALADRMVAIADSTLDQTEDVLRQTTVARRVGNQSEFELLR